MQLEDLKAMGNAPVSAVVCSACAEPLGPSEACLVCLLRAGLEEADGPAAASGARTFGDFEIERREDGTLWELGRGAMGVTYRAVDKVLHRIVALKVIETPANASDSHAVRERFLREARAAAALRHPNVAGVFHFGASPEVDRCYYAMELVEGETLEARVRRDGPLPVKLALEVAIQVTRALMAAAERGLVHRDLKPGNIMLTGGAGEAGEAKVIDFGLAKITAEAANEMDLTRGGFVGTPAFASPEQFGGQPADARSDIYSLGATLWYALTGEVPHPGKTLEEIRERQTQVPFPVERLSARKIPAAVITLLQRALAFDPARRPASPRELLVALEACRSNGWRVHRRAALVLGAALLLAAGLAWWNGPEIPGPAVSSMPEKSIAVLPFENLSDEKENSYFAAGVQDEILSHLARIADLKVISRTSANFYQSGSPRDAGEIGEQLGVAHLLEGSVQRAGQRMRVNAQLIDTRSGQHLWAQTYDRDVADVLVIQSEIARAIADQLRATISPLEQAAMTQPLTADLIANNLYTRALELEYKLPQPQDYWLEAVRLLEQAVARDPQFVRAYCKLAGIHLAMYFSGEDHTPARLDLARGAIETAARLQPEAGEVHLARARHFYYGFRDYDRARAELDLARNTLPNDPAVYYLSAILDRRQGRFTEAVSNFERALELDPRNWEVLMAANATYNSLRRYAEASRGLERMVRVSPQDYWARIGRADQPLDERGESGPLRRELDAICVEQPEAAPKIAGFLFQCAMLERDPAATARALAVMPPEGASVGGNFVFRREWFAGLAARAFQDPEGARTAFTAAREYAEELVRDRPDYAPAWSILGRIDAALGRKEDAIKAGRRACELLPVAKDAWFGPNYIKNLALIYAWIGERDLAFAQLELLGQKSLHYGDLKLDPEWDALRADPRFEKLLASYAPKEASP